MTDAYQLTYIGLWVMLSTLAVQAAVATVAHRRQSHYVPGILNPELSHESFVFRSQRTFLNSLENTLPMFASVVLAILIGVDAQWLAGMTFFYASARILHMLLYYRIATEKNPSPRSYFFMLGFLSQLALLGFIAEKL